LPFDADTPPDWHEDQPGVIEIPYQQLSEQALTGLVQEYVSRDGTDYGEYEVSLTDKADQVRHLLQQGKVVILFDPMSESCHIVDKAQYNSGC